jgi:hypothetical protein
MPDLITHVSTAYFVKKAGGRSWPAAIFYFGTILPDILTRPFYVLFPGLYWFVYPLHTPLVILLVCSLISYCFERNLRKGIFLSLTAGVSLHFLLDLFQVHVNGSNYWLFPFSKVHIEVGLFWHDNSVYAIPFLLLGVAAIELSAMLKRRRQIPKTPNLL